MNSYTSQNVKIEHKQRCEQQKITSIRILQESHVYWRKYFHKNPLYFSNIADFEADNEIDNSIIGNKTYNTNRQNPMLNSY